MRLFTVSRFVCHGLTTGVNYVFNVKAVNAAGYSQSSPSSDPVVVQAAICECPRRSRSIIHFARSIRAILSPSAPSSQLFLKHSFIWGMIAEKDLL